MKLFAKEYGASGETVVLIHGFAGSHAIWSGVAPLVTKAHRILAYDLPGHGNSHPWPETGTPKIAVRAILEDLTARGVERFHLAGHSMGGAISTLIAVREPERVASLTLFAPGGFGPEINARLLQRRAAAASETELRACLEAMTGWDSNVNDETVSAELAFQLREGQSDALTALAGVITREGRQGAIPAEQLAALEMPVAVAWGTIDNVLPVSQASGLPPQFAVHLLPGVGHMLPAEVPGFVAALIKRTAASSEPSRRA